MAAEYTDGSNKFTPTWHQGHIETVLTDTLKGKVVWYRGDVPTAQGIVLIVFSEPDGTLMTMISDGVIYDRRWQKQFQPRYLVTLARRFAAEIAEKEQAE